MKVKVWNTIQQLSKERGVGAAVIISAIEESLRVASMKYFSHNEKINIDFFPEKGELRVYSVKLIKESVENPAAEISLQEAKKIDATASVGSYVEVELPSETLGRIAAQAAKQVIFQKVRDAEQERIFKLFTPRLGEIGTGVLRRFESNRNMILEISKTEALLQERDKLPHDEFQRGDRVKALITQVLRDSKGPQVIVSRADPRFLAKLLALEIPEIENGQIEIKHIVRHPGERAKVAVASKEKDIDPIGACIGVRGNRILAISKELGGEKIDIIAWAEDISTYAKAALNPAKVDHISIIHKPNKILQALVPKDQLSLAIGKKGSNVRLASRLVGWKMEIKSLE